jgi:hypothetical protein
VLAARRADQPVQLAVDAAPPATPEPAVQVFVAGPSVQVGQVGPVGGGHLADPEDAAVGGERVVAVVTPVGG